ncbi:MAG: acyl--CoA ligase [Gammaproteobacteria bacterium]|nr:acyl--CoA ligase [Gammaproteobacteria bacterium]
MNDFKKFYETALEQLTTQPGSPFEIGRRDINGVSYKVFLNAPGDIPALIAPAREFGDQEFLVYEGERWSFADFFEQVDRLAYLLREKYGAKKSMRIAIAMRNYPEWMSCWLAVVSTGAVVVPINSLGSAEELHFNLQDSGAELVFCDQRRYDLLDANNSSIKAVVARPEREIAGNGHIALQALLDSAPAAASLPAHEHDIAAEDDAMIMYTSGTSGKPKGAVFTHHSCCQAIINLDLVGAVSYMTNEALFNKHFEKQLPIKSLLTVPLFHVSGLYSQFLPNLRGGRTLVMMYKWNSQVACELIEKERIANVVAAPSMLLELMECPAFDNIDVGSIMNISGGGAATPERLSKLRRDKTPDAMAGAGWGMTETGGSGASFTGAVARAKPLASGFVHAIVELIFRDEDGNEVAPGEPGEIWIKTPAGFSGYWNRPEENASEFIDGWFKSGDIGYLDEDGCINICDRAKDMVIRKGENIYPIEIENCILSMPGVEAVTAFAVPSESMGEELAVVVKCPSDAGVGDIDEASVQQHCAKHLAAFKVPSFVKLTNQPFPLNASDKVIKRQVRDQYFPVS